MKFNKPIGNYGEDLATAYLKTQGYHILSRNFQTRYGEIDIICKKDTLIIFCEIKSRYSDSFGTPIESVTCYKQSKIISVSSYYIYKYRLQNYNIRYDVIEVLFNNITNNYKINHIKDAFRTY